MSPISALLLNGLINDYMI